MTAFLQQYISPALPVILWLFRGVTAGLAVWLLVRCCKSLFRGRDRESWGFVTVQRRAVRAVSLGERHRPGPAGRISG